ncbi:hypothetical protein CABS01_08835 [Colletotrichum abscissum]|uniref:Uncharacterized protein n=3 Tax=Colletotrichum acutatum species complex TaxID=2707335 RepID=A0AAJ0E854_9PEZI|nr:uncharacterized protein CCOS01_00688 [Colletotrichum costaricense]XP_060384131.1 uncharacterized protein CTAM01_05295 [Colletotrichum tamarilloi]XP_060401083.1 uncharacterized protein CABS01_08835 [Colletotrichum abscissum]KAI3550226.1 hypothetical protein CSPX01_01824 [Colletotrichum filicis]KAK1453714.1 hypothetical protein CMEL01_05373 [Colletotrichum melonis]KAK1502482.1 hypothetical protein CTAM01_05295 [Colletotrichum tamarilloi]KAK1505057.1 hypothetical protein CABS01_08835 [Colleto
MLPCTAGKKGYMTLSSLIRKEPWFSNNVDKIMHGDSTKSKKVGRVVVGHDES